MAPFRDARVRGDRMAAIDAVKGNSTRFALGAAERALVNALGSKPARAILSSLPTSA